MSDKLYNVVKKGITNGLIDETIAQNMNYIMLYDAPVGANVTFKYNDPSADAIDIKVGTSIKTQDAEQIYVSADSVASGTITLIQAKNIETFELFLPVEVNDINTISNVTQLDGISTSLNTALDKIVNPYQDPTTTNDSGNSSSTTTILNKTLSCDKITLILTVSNTAVHAFGDIGITAYLDGHVLCTCREAQNNDAGFNTGQITLENVNGKTLSIKGRSYDVGGYYGYCLQEFTKKA